MNDLARRPVVLLDAGGTLITIDTDRVRTIVSPFGPRPTDAEFDQAETLARAWADSRVRERLSWREVWDGYFGQILERIGLPECDLGGVLDELWETHHADGLWGRPIPGARDALDRLRAGGKRLAVISNAEGRVEQDLEEAGFGGLFETVVDSHLVGVSKPDPRIFAIALERIGALAEDCLYVGDVPAFDVDGALAAGITPVLVDPHGFHEGVRANRIRSIGELPALLGI